MSSLRGAIRKEGVRWTNVLTTSPGRTRRENHRDATPKRVDPCSEYSTSPTSRWRRSGSTTGLDATE
jgi:hypothetical protein